MSTTPEGGGAAGDQRGARPQDAAGGQGPSSTGAGGGPGDGRGMTAGQPAGSGPAQPVGTEHPAEPQWRREWGTGLPAATAEAVFMEHETKVTGRRFVQFVIDSILSNLIPGILFAIADAVNGTLTTALLWTLGAIAWVVIMVWYWVVRPKSANGQTFGMQLLQLRVVSKDGDAASTPQLFIRWVFLILPLVSVFFAIVDWIIIICSRYRQRFGDHLARCVVVKADSGFGGYGTPRRADAGMTMPAGRGPAGPAGDTR
jgi:uncharacterized RDD family membrane protein YckC